MVDGQVGKIEEAVAHARVLPVDDPDLAVVQEVGVEKVVVARHLVLGTASTTDLLRGVLRRGEFRRDGYTVCESLVTVLTDDGMGVKPARDPGCAVDLSQDGSHTANPVGGTDLIGRHDASLDEARHEPAFRLLESDYLGPNPDLSRSQARRMFRGPLDAEKVRVLAAGPQYVGGAVDVHTVVAVGDPAGKGGDARLAAPPQPLDSGDRLSTANAIHSFGG